MATGILEIDLEGSATYDNLLHALEAVSPASLAFFLETEGHEIIIRRLKVRFQGEGDDAAGKWAGLRPLTQNFRRWGGFPPAHPINHRTGALERWLSNDSGEVSMFGGGGAEMVFPGSSPGGWLEEKFETAQLGRDGGDPDWNATVPRPVVAMNENDHRLIREALAFYIAARMNK